jgi:hypothetical protein
VEADIEMEVEDNVSGEDRMDRIRKLIEEGRLEEVRREVFCKGVLDMLESGEFNLNLNILASHSQCF